MVVAACGVPGPEGPAGADGANGRDGTNGVDGTDGRDGTDGVDGMNGAQGPAGPQGPQGVYDAGAPMPRPVVAHVTVQRPGLTQTFDVLSFSFITRTALDPSTGLPTGRSSFAPLALELRGASTTLVATTTSSLTLELVTAGTPERLLHLTDVLFTLVQPLGIADGELEPSFRVEAAFVGLELTSGGSTSSWDVVLGSGVCGAACDCAATVSLGDFAQSSDWSWPAPTGAQRVWSATNSLTVIPPGPTGGQSRYRLTPLELSMPFDAQGPCRVMQLALSASIPQTRVSWLAAPVSAGAPNVAQEFVTCQSSRITEVRLESGARGVEQTLALTSPAGLWRTPLADGGVDSVGVNLTSNTLITTCPP